MGLRKFTYNVHLYNESLCAGCHRAARAAPGAVHRLRDCLPGGGRGALAVQIDPEARQHGDDCESAKLRAMPVDPCALSLAGDDVLCYNLSHADATLASVHSKRVQSKEPQPGDRIRDRATAGSVAIAGAHLS